MRLSIRRMMIGMVFVGVALAAARVHPALGCFTAAVSCLALVRTFGILDRPGLLPPWRTLAVLLKSVVVAVTIMVVALLPGLCLLRGVTWNQGDLNAGTLVGLMIAGILALLIVYPIREILW